MVDKNKKYRKTNFYWRPVYIAASKEYLKRIQIIFMVLESAFH